ncbi:tonB-system energizer ExbB [Ancylobacter sp. A5.8]|nr:tonB-system energizer ExbB [Ancylobacter gelatini]MCJ8144268.1 tonB-system energizer ExbB [Ancylobacter gelatini]
MLRRTAPFHACAKVFVVVSLLCGPTAPAFAQQPDPAAPVAAPSVATPASEAPSVAAPAVVEPLVPAMPTPTSTAPTSTATGAGGAPEASPNPSPVEAAAPLQAGDVPADPMAGPAEMPAAAEDASAPAISAQLPHDLSPWGMFMAADIVVKAVMLGLAFASVVTWTVWLAKTLELMVAQRRLRSALRGYLASPSLDAARKVGAAGPAGAMLAVTDLELKRSGDLPAEGIKERVSISLSRIEVAAGRAITRGTGLLATIGATAPFVGLFGTVWGIMNSFIGISKAQTTNLAVVAPGIAEALLATAIGLVAAIPAVVIYNHFSRQVSGYRVLMGDASAEVLRLLSRDLDRRDAGHRDPRQKGVESSVRLRAAAE